GLSPLRSRGRLPQGRWRRRPSAPSPLATPPAPQGEAAPPLSFCSCLARNVAIMRAHFLPVRAGGACPPVHCRACARPTGVPADEVPVIEKLRNIAIIAHVDHG